MSFITNKKRLSFDDFLSESTYYSDSSTKSVFIDDESNLATGFMFSFLGMLGLLNGAKNKNILLTHFRRDKKLQISTINDDNNNTSLIIKLMNDAGAFRSTAVVTEITKFLVLLRGGNIDTISDAIVRGWIDNINVSWLSKNLDSKLRGVLKEFLDSSVGSLHGLATRLFRIKSSYPDNIVNEFIDLARSSRFEKKIGKGFDTDLDSTEPEEIKQNTIKLPSSEQVSEIILNSNLSFHDIKEDSIRKILKLISVAVSLSKNAPAGIDSEYPTKEEMNDATFVEKNKHILDLCIIPVIEKMKQSDFKFLYDKLFYDKQRVYGFDSLTNLEKYLRLLLLKSHERIKDTIVDELRIGRGFYSFLAIFGESNIEKEFGSYINFAESIFSAIDITDIEIILKFANNLLATSISEFQKARPFFTKKYLESLALIVEREKRLPRNLLRKLNFISLSNSVTVNVSLAEMEPYVLRIKRVILSLPKTSNEYRDEIKFIMDIVNDYSFKGNFPKALNEQFIDLYVDSLDELDLTSYASADALRRINVTKNNVANTLENLLPKIKQKLLTFNLKRTVIQSLTDKEKFINEIDNIDEINKLIDQYSNILDITDIEEKEYLFTEIFNSYMSFGSLSIMKNYKPLMLDMMLYKDQNFPHILKINQSFERFERLIVTGIFNDVSKEQTEKIAKAIVDNPNGYFSRIFSKETIKSISNRGQKNMLKEFYFDLIFDNIETNPRLVDALYEGMDGYFQNQVRSKMIAANSIVALVQKGPIFPFEDLSTNRLKEILSFNNIDIEAGLGAIKLPRKGKYDTISKYLEKVKPIMNEIENTVLGKLKVEDNNLTVDDLNKKTVDIVNKTFAGRHGSIYPKIIKSFTVSLPTDRYEAFMAEMERAKIDNKHIVPAFHGTGGVAAAMILRYGFKIIKSNDPSFTGAMLGGFKVLMRRKRIE